MMHTLIYQENMSAYLLETNRTFLGRKRTKYIKMTYFFLKDKINERESRSDISPESKWDDMLLKPSQGIRFKQTGVGCKMSLSNGLVEHFICCCMMHQ